MRTPLVLHIRRLWAHGPKYAFRILEKQLNEPDTPSPSTTPRTPPVRRAVHFPDEAPGPYGGPNDC